MSRTPQRRRRPSQLAPCLLAIAALLAGPLRGAGDFPEPTPIAPGLGYTRVVREGLVAHVIKMDLKVKNLRVRSIKAKGKESVRRFVDRFNAEGDARVVAAISGDFFRMESMAGLPYGVQVSDGRLIFAPMRRCMIGFKATNEPFMGIVDLKARLSFSAKSKRGPSAKWPTIDGVNSTEEDLGGRRGIFLYTPAFLGLESSRPLGLVAVVEAIQPALQVGEVCEGTVARVETADKPIDIPESGCLLCFYGDAARQIAKGVKAGQPVAIEIELPPIPSGAVSQAIGGGPRLVRDGKVSVELGKEAFSPMQRMEISSHHPRAAIGYDRSRQNLFLVMVEGRHEASRGMTFEELAKFMVEWGCHQGMAFDGGGSAAMYVAGKGIVSRGEEREIANGILITEPSRGVPFPKKTAEKDVPKKAEPAAPKKEDAPAPRRPGGLEPPPFPKKGEKVDEPWNP